MRCACYLAMESLTPRQLEVLCHLADGKSNKEIAATLGVSVATIGAHVSRLIARYGVSSRAGVVGAAARAKELPCAGAVPLLMGNDPAFDALQRRANSASQANSSGRRTATSPETMKHSRPTQRTAREGDVVGVPPA
ncbi:MAG: response regulator transcription factor [Chloroflexota bacterium]|nr:response regulator transcription factor [Chloroflexota bacterium]